jgi:hypothetical protein
LIIVNCQLKRKPFDEFGGLSVFNVECASFLHPGKSIILDKGSVISTGLFTQQYGGLVIFQPLNLAIVVKPNSWEIVSEMVFDGE